MVVVVVVIEVVTVVADVVGVVEEEDVGSTARVSSGSDPRSRK
jgi:hypothetical protein